MKEDKILMASSGLCFVVELVQVRRWLSESFGHGGRGAGGQMQLPRAGPAASGTDTGRDGRDSGR